MEPSLDKWLQFISEQAEKNIGVILVGTHLDGIETSAIIGISFFAQKGSNHFLQDSKII